MEMSKVRKEQLRRGGLRLTLPVEVVENVENEQSRKEKDVDLASSTLVNSLELLRSQVGQLWWQLDHKVSLLLIVDSTLSDTLLVDFALFLDICRRHGDVS